MKSIAKSGFRRFPFLVKITRLVRQAKPAWRTISVDLEREANMGRLLANQRSLISDYLALHEIKKLQIGAGTNPLPGWLNTDFEPTHAGILYLDATKPFPFQDNQFDYVFSEHMIEHIPYKDGMFMMKEVFRVVKPGGKIRIATPDIEKIVGLFTKEKTDLHRQYIEWKLNDNMGLYSPEKSQLQQRKAEWDINYEHIRKYYPNIREDGVSFIVNQFFRGYGHQFIYDTISLSAIMREAGFVNIRRCDPGISEDENLRGIESHSSLIGDLMNEFETMILEGDCC